MQASEGLQRRKKNNKKEGGEEEPYLLRLFTGKIRRIEGDNLDTFLLGAPQPTILLLCPSALRPSGAPLGGRIISHQHILHKPETLQKCLEPQSLFKKIFLMSEAGKISKSSLMDIRQFFKKLVL